MTAPTVVPLARAAVSLRTRIPRPQSLDRLFVVVESGKFAGRDWDRGEILEVDDGEGLAILAPRGHGRLRMGTVDGTRLFGEAGEPCLPARWEVLGRVCSVFRSVGADWVEEVVGGGAGRLLAAA